MNQLSLYGVGLFKAMVHLRFLNVNDKVISIDGFELCMVYKQVNYEQYNLIDQKE